MSNESRPARVIAVVRALSLAGAVAAASSSALSCAQAHGAGFGTSRTCPANPPNGGSSCAAFAQGLECTWYDAVRCTCTAPPAAAANRPSGDPQWRCISRGVPGPLPPPELSA